MHGRVGAARAPAANAGEHLLRDADRGMDAWVVPRRTLAPMSCFCGLCTSRQPASHETSADTFRRHRNRGATTSRSTLPNPAAAATTAATTSTTSTTSYRRRLPMHRRERGAQRRLVANRRRARRQEGASVRAQQRRVRVDAVCSTRHAELCSSCQCEGDDGAWRCCDGYLLVMARSAQLSGSSPPPPSGPPGALLSAKRIHRLPCCRRLWEEDDEDDDEKRVAASLAPKPGTHGRCRSRGRS